MVTTRIKHNGREVRLAYKEVERLSVGLSPVNMKRLVRTAESETRRLLQRTATQLIRRHSKPWAPGASRNRRDGLFMRSGGSIAKLREYRVAVRNKTVTGTMPLSKQMTMHEYGGIIRARNATYLTIPLDAALNANGTPKKRSAREWKNTFVRKSKKGNLIIFQKQGSNIVPLYVLKRRVRIPPRLGLRKEMRSQRPIFRERIIRRVRALVRSQRETGAYPFQPRD